MEKNLTYKLLALLVVGSVAKALFAPPRVHNTTQIVNKAADAVLDAVQNGDGK